MKVKFVSCTQAQYLALATHDNGTFYYLTDKAVFYRGAQRFGTADTLRVDACVAADTNILDAVASGDGATTATTHCFTLPGDIANAPSFSGLAASRLHDMLSSMMQTLQPHYPAFRHCRIFIDLTGTSAYHLAADKDGMSFYYLPEQIMETLQHSGCYDLELHLVAKWTTAVTLIVALPYSEALHVSDRWTYDAGRAMYMRKLYPNHIAETEILASLDISIHASRRADGSISHYFYN